MAIGDGQAWDESNPQQGTLVNQIDSYERDVRIGTRVRMANEHVWPSSQSNTGQAGQHTYVSFQVQTSTPTMPVVASVTQAGMLFMTATGLVFQNSAGATGLVVSSAGGLNVNGASYSATGTFGDILVGTGTGTIASIVGSTDGFLLRTHSNTAAPDWVNPTTLGYTISNTNNLRILFGSGGTVGAGSNASVSFSTNFAATPIVVLTPNWVPAVTPDEAAGMMSIGGVGVSGFTVYNTDNTAKSYSYMAIGSK